MPQCLAQRLLRLVWQAWQAGAASLEAAGAVLRTVELEPQTLAVAAEAEAERREEGRKHG